MTSLHDIGFLKIHFLYSMRLLWSWSATAYKISSKSDDISLKDGAITIINMAIIRHDEFSKFESFHI